MGNSTFTARSQAAGRKLPGILALLALLMGVVGLFVPVSAAGADNGPGEVVAGPASEKGVQPQLLGGTQGQTCGDFDPDWYEVGKIEEGNLQEGGVIADEEGREFKILDVVRESVTNEVVYFDWEANFEPTAVFVAGGTDRGSGQAGNLYDYEDAIEDPALQESADLYRDGSLHAPGRWMEDGTFVPFAVSHISVCLERVPTPETFALNLLKVDAADDSVLAGAQFDLYLDEGGTAGELDDGDTLVDSCTTDEDGECTFDGLDPGDYLLVETDAPEGYEAASDDPVAVTIVDADADVTVENVAVVTPPTFALNLLKVDAADDSVLAGAQFDLYLDEGGTAGELDDGDTLVGSCTTDSAGQCEFDGLDPGDYLLVETDAPEGYEAASDDPVAVTIVDADADVTVENVAVVVTPPTFELNLLKVEEGDPSNVLQGAEFALFADVGTVGVLDDDDSFVANCTTDAAGECEFDGLAAGNYLLVETRAPEGFVAVSDDPIAVSIVDADQNVTVDNAPVAVGGIVAERPDIALEKTADPVIANVGDTVTYTYTITNTGETILSDLVLVDDKLGVILLPEVVLQPGASTQVQATHVVTQADAQAGEIVNVAIVTGRSPAGEEVSARDSAEVAVVAVEGVTVTRPAPDAPQQEAAPKTQAAQLARTGVYTRSLLVLAVVALFAGAGFLRAADRREQETA